MVICTDCKHYDKPLKQHNNNSLLTKKSDASYLIIPSAKTQPVHITASLFLSLTLDTPITAVLKLLLAYSLS